MNRRISEIDIIQLLRFLIEHGGRYEKEILREDELAIDNCYNLYYSSPNKLIIAGKYYEYFGKRYEFDENERETSEENFESVIKILKSDISHLFHKTFEKLEWEYEELKYFKREPEKYQLFISTIEELKNKENPLDEFI